MRSEPPTGDELTRMLVSMKRKVLDQVANEPASAARSRSTHRMIGLGVGVTLLLGVGAGAAFALGIVPSSGDPVAGTTAPAASTAPVDTPTPTPSLEYDVTAGQPASRYGVDCATMIDDALVSALFATSLEPVDPIVSASGVGISIPRDTFTLAVGGTVCEWSNDVPIGTFVGLEPKYVGVHISVVPRPAAGWSEKAARFGHPRDEGMCPEYSYSCWATAVVGDSWVAIEANGIASAGVDQTAWQEFADAVMAAVADAGPAEPAAFTEQTSAPSLDACEALVPLDRARSITATPDADARGLYGGGNWSEWGEARLVHGDVACSWAVEDLSVARIDSITDGRWAYERMLLAGTTSPVELPGLPSGDTAVIRCDVRAESNCAVDLTIGLDWYNVSANDRDNAIAMAEELLARRTE